MESDLLASADAHPGVNLVRLEANADPNTTAELRVLGTPTVIGFVEGQEAFRRTGRMNRQELDQAFESLVGAVSPPIARTDGWLRVVAGVALILAGVLVELSWPLFLGGTAVLAWGMSTLLQRSP